MMGTAYLGAVRRLACVGALLALGVTQAHAAEAFTLTSPGLSDGGTLESTHAASTNNCGGGNVSPALQWRNVPAGTRSFAVTMFDPDGAKGLGIVHWVLYGIAPSVTAMEAGAAPPAGSVAGTNRTGGPGYYGPCPPVGDVPHHYLAQVYALDLAPNALPAGLTRDALLAAMKDHVVAAASTVLRYGR
ncbi:YbhB/YbcL family Raf kinase inhibitor-like protein [bacterium M00.F.Ca.ET.228.01.1.1]|uniref:YbhB/YbcL family Raf kinase inhibitor-like protein n=1 Tax=Paraburkholderia phenoliruptrix TaxID=252970 RepID=UPI001091F887|nr:YbhB/YbcL family Raf kinase inhibitor-like protein [Paraburkholderia phenoliruptrix]TGP47315.1 YbhB/YbcL family Raf kinase inhibitor-like protein [bacterium M00.F.Ca.ET.228.01.1.1]TGS05107.1 YbhB/YbcL family Raf kinase inhibitor-like protein [bacterium M00.F.Ca.ET.191.01.1.1]TGU10042.1 YbhB/YbcL family Raf kinase inhibitor-like protein [bacterium M00.F.Ca.ET.155.01.1.1]MBW0451197.1 YbhB/YbcL family Raf kinase inhibitor-like protein [Paraburkholderia phenoliruptrix]MBW9100152.1 YbhB/YbcL fam